MSLEGVDISIFRQPFERHDYKGGLDSALVYYLLDKYGSIKKEKDIIVSVFDQFPGGEVIKIVSVQLGMMYFTTDFPTEDARYLTRTDGEFDVVVSHPPYWNAIGYSDHENDLANCKTYEEFLDGLYKSLAEAVRVLAPDGFFIFICGDLRRDKKLTLVHADIYQHMKKYKNMVLRDDTIWELSASSTPMISTQWMIQGTHCLVYEKTGTDAGVFFE